MKIFLLPKKRSGKWCVASAAAATALVVVRLAFVPAAGPGTGDWFFSNPPAEILNILAWLCGAVAFLAGAGALSERDLSWAALAGGLSGFGIFVLGVIRMMSP